MTEKKEGRERGKMGEGKKRERGGWGNYEMKKENGRAEMQKGKHEEKRKKQWVRKQEGKKERERAKERRRDRNKENGERNKNVEISEESKIVNICQWGKYSKSLIFYSNMKGKNSIWSSRAFREYLLQIHCVQSSPCQLIASDVFASVSINSPPHQVPRGI